MRLIDCRFPRRPERASPIASLVNFGIPNQGPRTQTIGLLQAHPYRAVVYRRACRLHQGERHEPCPRRAVPATDDLFVCSTSGSAKKLGQIFKFVPGRGRSADVVELFFENEREDQFNYGDNLTVAPNGHLIVCED
jgi:hypothetical protein